MKDCSNPTKISHFHQRLASFAELSEEDPSLEGEYTSEVDRVAKMLDEFELKAIMSGKREACSADVSTNPAGGPMPAIGPKSCIECIHVGLNDMAFRLKK